MKSHNTDKGPVSIASSGIVTFISCLYWDHISVKKITQESGLIDHLESGDGVIFDRGFDI